MGLQAAGLLFPSAAALGEMVTRSSSSRLSTRVGSGNDGRGGDGSSLGEAGKAGLQRLTGGMSGLYESTDLFGIQVGSAVVVVKSYWFTLRRYIAVMPMVFTPRHRRFCTPDSMLDIMRRTHSYTRQFTFTI